MLNILKIVVQWETEDKNKLKQLRTGKTWKYQKLSTKKNLLPFNIISTKPLFFIPLQCGLRNNNYRLIMDLHITDSCH